MSIAPRYETAHELSQRLGHTDSVVCADCGVFVMDTAAHTRFHAILSSHAWALAILQTSHTAPAVHDRYDVRERIGRKKFGNWSADALAQAISKLAPDDGSGAERAGNGDGQ